MGVFTTQGYRGKLVDATTGKILDTFADEDIKVSNNVLELFDLGELPGTYTQQITLPGTKVNNAFFEHYYDISVYSPDLFNTNQKVEAYLDFDGFYLVNGYLQLNKVNVLENKFVDSYEVTLFGIISNFSIDTKTSFLTDLSTLNVYNHTSSLSNITSSWNKGLFNGDIVYQLAEFGQSIFYSPIANYGIDDSAGSLSVQDYKPTIRLKKVWDACFSEFGYTYTGSFWNQSWLNDVYLTLNNNLRTVVYPAFNAETYGQASVTCISGSALTGNNAYGNGGISSWLFDGKDYDYNNFLSIGAVNTTYIVEEATTLDLSFNLAFQVSKSVATAGSGAPQFYLYYYSGSAFVTSSLDRINTYMRSVANSNTTTQTVTYNLPYILRTPTLTSGSWNIKLQQQAFGVSNYQVKLNPDAQNLCSLKVAVVNQATDGLVVDVPFNMPNGTSGIKVIDFIRSIQKKFNLIIYPDKQNPNQFIVETFNNWYNTGQIQDFNKYINLADKIAFTPANQLGYKKIRFSDADDTDYIETLFKRTNNRVYGESNYYDTGSYYSQGELNVISDVVASGPLGRVPATTYSGSLANSGCATYQINYGGSGPLGSAAAYYYNCAGSPATQSMGGGTVNAWICAQVGSVRLAGSQISWELQGNCSSGVSTSGSNPMFIPYYISDDKYNPARVLPRIMFYNGLIQTSPYWISGYNPVTSNTSVVNISSSYYPYFDNYSTGSLNGTSSAYPQLNSLSLLYNNEQAVWGTTPTGSLVTNYWSKYLGLLYNPRTRLLDANAVIPLADYFNIELNDIAEFRGNYYHLRAINDYNLTTGECAVQLLGPIIADTFNPVIPGPATTSTTTTTTTGTTTTTSTTTTTTTFNANPCACMEVVVTSDGAGWDILDCFGINLSVAALYAGTYYTCVNVIGGLPQLNVTYGTATYGQVGNCKTQSCPPATTTSTTTTTTTGTTTTTTTSTTTTTTTFNANPCACMEVIVTSAGATWDILDCFGINMSVAALYAGTYYTCVNVIGGLPQLEITSGTATYGQVGNCKTQTCPPPTTTTSTTTTTTTLPPVDLTTSGGCENYTSSDGVGAIVTIFGGSGTYQASNTTYSTEALALAGTYTTVSTLPRTFSGLAAGTYWVAARDASDSSNKRARSFVISTCATTTTTTQPVITYGEVVTCTGTTQTITINTLAGGNGTFYMNTTTYADAVAAAAGTTTLVTDAGGTARTFTGQPSGARYVYITSGARTSMFTGGNTCTTTTSTTTTTTTLPPFHDSVCISNEGGDQDSACNSCPVSFIMTGNYSTFCTSTVFTGDTWYYTATGNYWLSFGGQVLRVTHTVGQNTATLISAGCQTCPSPTTTTTTTTTSTTTTTTTAPAYDFYLANEYDCNTPPCSTIRNTDVPVAFPAGYSYISTHYYNDINLDGFLYKITSTTTPQAAVILDPTLPHGTNCTSICAV